MGAGALGGHLSRAGIQTQCLAHATSGRTALTLANTPRAVTYFAGSVARTQRTVARRTDSNANDWRQLCPTGLGSMVAGARRILRLHPAARRVAFSWAAPHQSSSTPI